MKKKELEKHKELMEKVGVPPDNPDYFPLIYTAICKEKKKKKASKDMVEQILSEEYDSLSRRVDLSAIQESCSVRNVLKTRLLSKTLINDEGKLDRKKLQKAISILSKRLHGLGPDRHYDSKRHEQMLRTLIYLEENRQQRLFLTHISHPSHNPVAEELIRETMGLASHDKLTDVDAKRAILSAMLCCLRQNVGSCFATAPAILIQIEQPHQLLKDLKELFETGRLKRTFAGIEYSVPLSQSWGSGDLKKFVTFQKTKRGNLYEIAFSPALIASLERVEIVDHALPLKKKLHQVNRSIELWLKEEEDRSSPLFSVTAEELISGLVRQKYGLTKQDLSDYEERPKEMIHSGLLLHTAHVSSGGKGQACASFHQSFALAKNTFKSYAENALLKAWEFTLASFAENKAGFTQWNLYSSLGLKPDDLGGIGRVIFQILQEKVDQLNQKIQDFQIEYEQVYGHVKHLETRIRSASETEAKWLKAEYQSRVNEFHNLETMRDQMHYKAKRLAQLFDELIDFYLAQFPRYFQEVYDADMHDISPNRYDDSPAGFRLLYKHGRAESSLWTKIYTPTEFIQALSHFFTLVETEMKHTPDFEDLQEEIGGITTAVIMQVKTDEFLTTAFHRMAEVHGGPKYKCPLDHLEKIDKKPWAYTSGGSMRTLISAYYKRVEPPEEKERWVENPTELVVFLIDSIKQLPEKMRGELTEKPEKSILMHSPTHAFLLKPSYTPLKEAWQTEEFTYTWVRDELISPAQTFVSSIRLHGEMVHYLLSQLERKVPSSMRTIFREIFVGSYGSMAPEQFRSLVIDAIDRKPHLKYAGQSVLSPDLIDHLLYEELPLSPTYLFEEKAFAILQGLELPQVTEKELSSLVALYQQKMEKQPYFGAITLLNLCKSILCILYRDSSVPINYHKEIAQSMQKRGYAMPTPILFADSNWTKDEFAFAMNPGTGSLELWRMDEAGTTGYPIPAWKQFLNGVVKTPTWGVYPNLYEYTL